MGSSVAGKKRTEPYVTDVDGQSIECESLSDALMLKIAHFAAATGHPGPCEQLSVERMIQVARKYGFDEIADAINRLNR